MRSILLALLLTACTSEKDTTIYYYADTGGEFDYWQNCRKLTNTSPQFLEAKKHFIKTSKSELQKELIGEVYHEGELPSTEFYYNTSKACEENLAKARKWTKEEQKNSPALKEVSTTPRRASCRTDCEEVDQKICQDLIREYKTCKTSKTEESCTGFIQAFDQALPKTVNCKNTCDTEAYQMAITQVCDETDPEGYPKITERSAHLLASLKFPKARQLLISKKFHNILDGALAEDLKPLTKETK